jgi:hypothetical protein
MQQPECAQYFTKSLLDDSAMMSESIELFTGPFIYGSIAVLAVCAFAAMWIIRK